jgi:hypothetical protein
MSPCVEDLIFLIWFSLTFLYENSEHSSSLQGGNFCVKRIKRGVSRVIGSHDSSCVAAGAEIFENLTFSHPKPDVFTSG